MTIYIAFYKGRADKWRHRFQDALIRLITRGKYSHCEIAVQAGSINYQCFTSSPRDGGVRAKTMPLPPAKWDLVAIEVDYESVVDFYKARQGKKYDWVGVLSFLLPLSQNPNRYFCSEFCAEFLRLPNPYEYSPNDLYDFLKRKPKS